MLHKLILISFIPALVSDDSASFLLIAFLVEFANLLLTGVLNPFVEAELDRLNRNSLIIVCLVLLYGIAIRVKPDAAVDPQDSQIQVGRFDACSQAPFFSSLQGIILSVMNVGVLLSVPIQFYIENTAEVLKQATRWKVVTLVQTWWRQMRSKNVSKELAAVEEDSREQLRAAIDLSLRPQLPEQMQNQGHGAPVEPAELVQPGKDDTAGEALAEDARGPQHESHIPTRAEDTDCDEIQVSYC